MPLNPEGNPKLMNNPKMTLYALAVLTTSHGLFTPGQVLPLSEMEEAEVDQLEHDETAFLAENDSPFADKAREARGMTDPHRAAAWLLEFATDENKHAAEPDDDEDEDLPDSEVGGAVLVLEVGTAGFMAAQRLADGSYEATTRVLTAEEATHFKEIQDALMAGPDGELLAPPTNPLLPEVERLTKEVAGRDAALLKLQGEYELLLASTKDREAREKDAKVDAAAPGPGEPPAGASPTPTGNNPTPPAEQAPTGVPPTPQGS